MQIIKIQDLSKSFRVGDQDIPILKNISLEINNGDFGIIFGPSGCGKSTLLHTLLGLEAPTKGTIYFLDRNLYATNDVDENSDFRKKHIGMVYQQPNWIKALTVIENVAFPLLLLGMEKNQSLEKSYKTLQLMEMLNWVNYIPTELSSGQQQRVALARAIITDPEVIIADEPTGNLDFESGQNLMQLLTTLNQDQGKTILMVTHDLEYLKYAKTAIKMFNGEIEGIYTGKQKDTLLSNTKNKRGIGANGILKKIN